MDRREVLHRVGAELHQHSWQEVGPAIAVDRRMFSMIAQFQNEFLVICYHILAPHDRTPNRV